MLGLSGKARGLDMDLDPLVGVNKGRSILNSKSRCVTYVSAMTFNWFSKRSNCNHVSCNTTNINTRDGSEDLRAVSKRFRSCFRNDKKLEKDPRGSKITGR